MVFIGNCRGYSFIKISQLDTRITVANNIYKAVDFLRPNWPRLELAFNSSIPNTK